MIIQFRIFCVLTIASKPISRRVRSPRTKSLPSREAATHPSPSSNSVPFKTGGGCWCVQLRTHPTGKYVLTVASKIISRRVRSPRTKSLPSREAATHPSPSCDSGPFKPRGYWCVQLQTHPTWECVLTVASKIISRRVRSPRMRQRTKS